MTEEKAKAREEYEALKALWTAKKRAKAPQTKAK
jgi:hypothetical protein